MLTTSPAGNGVTPATAVKVPQHVVARAFAAETVVLNLETGVYHSLNPTGGRMLEVLGESSTIDAAASVLAAEYDQPVDMIRQDLCAFAAALVERGLLEIRS